MVFGGQVAEKIIWAKGRASNRRQKFVFGALKFVIVFFPNLVQIFFKFFYVKNLCIKLVKKKKDCHYYDARSTKYKNLYCKTNKTRISLQTSLVV